jgi:hypothetical protein
MKRVVLIASVGLNLVLAMAMVRFRHESSESAPRAPVARAMPEPVAISKGVSAGPKTAEAVSAVTNRFHWRRIESEDYAQYVANLRGIGCPEKTICDIVTADVEKAYTIKRTVAPFPGGFWSSGTRRAAATQVQEARERALEAEKGALLQRVLGPDCSGEWNEQADDLVEQALMRFVIGPVSDGTVQKVFTTIKQGEELVKEIRNRANGIMLPEDEAALAKVSGQSLEELKRLLTPEQLEEFAARGEAIGMMDHGMEYFQTTATELRQIAHIHAAVFWLGDGKGFNLFDHQEESPVQDKEFETRLRAYLGEKRFAEYQRAKDPVFQGVVDLTEPNSLSASAAAKVYDIKQLADAGRQTLAADGSVAGPEREAQLRQIQDTTRLAVQGVLGEKAFAAYLQQGNGRWVTNFVNP